MSKNALDLGNVNFSFESAKDFANAIGNDGEETSGELVESDDFDSLLGEETEKVDKPINNEESEEGEEYSEESSDDLLNTFATELFSQGIFPDLDDKAIGAIKDFDGLKLAVQTQLEASFETWKTDYKQDILNSLIAEGIIEKADVKIDMNNNVYKEADLDDEDTAKRMLKEYYELTGLSAKHISKLIDNSIDIVEDAKDVLPEYKEIKDKQKLNVTKVLEEREKTRLKEIDEAEKAIEKNVMNVENFIPGQKIDRKFKEKVLSGIPETLNKIQSDLQKYLPILGYLDAYGMLDGDFSKIVKVTDTKAVNAFMDKLNAKKGEPKEMKFFKKQ